MMTVSDWINLILTILSFILAATSVIIVVVSIRQNNRMLEASTRPVLSFYTDEVNTGTPTMFFIVRNFGQSTAIIQQIECDHDFSQFLRGIGEITDIGRFKQLKGASIAPGQSRKCALEYTLVPNEIVIHVIYRSSSGKDYNETVRFNPKAGLGMLVTKDSGKDSLKTISYAIQEQIQKNL